MDLESGWLTYYNLCWSGFRHIAFQIRLRLLRPCKILASTLMSLCVCLMCPACSLTFPLMKPSKSVQMPFTTILIYNSLNCWESFSSPKLKISLISTLVHRALMICTKRRLNEEIERIKKILLDNGYPRNVINTQIAKKIARFYTLKRFGPEKCPVYLRVLGLVSPPQTWKKKSKPPWKAAMVPLAPAWSYVNAHAACGPQGCSTCYSYMNINATVIVGT